jgi:hypothetical protein
VLPAQGDRGAQLAALDELAREVER